MTATPNGKQSPGNAARRDKQLGSEWNSKLYLSFLRANTRLWKALTWDLPSREADVDKKEDDLAPNFGKTDNAGRDETIKDLQTFF